MKKDKKKLTQTSGSLSLAEREKIIELAVKNYEKEQAKLPFNQRKFSFSITGASFTRIIRDFWSSDMASKAINDCRQCLIAEDENGNIVYALTLDDAVDVVTGKKMFIGDSRCTAIELVEDDGRFNDEFDNYSVEEMIARLERYYITRANDRVLFLRVLNLLKNDLNNDGNDPIQFTSDPNTEWLTPNQIRRKVEYLNKEIEKFTNELDFLYPFVKKSLKNLPIEKIGSEMNEIEKNIADIVGGPVQRSQFEKLEEDKKIKELEAKRAIEEARYEREQRREKEDLEKHRYLITPIKDEELKTVTSCWLLPDGTMFGGPGYIFIHDHIMFYLKQDNYFENPDVINEKVLENMGWCKLSRGHGFMSYGNFEEEHAYTDAQRARIIDWALAHEVDVVRLNGSKVPLKHLMEMTGKDMVHYSSWKHSDSNPYKDDPDLDDSVTDDELLEMFPPKNASDEMMKRRILADMKNKKK